MRPSPLHEALLKAALSPAPEALEAFRSVRDRFDLDRLDVAAQRLLPLLARRLADAGCDDPILSKCRKVARFTWLRSNLLLAQTRLLVEALRREGIPVMLTKGAAVVIHTGLPIELRPMDDLDVLVPRGAAERAIDLALREGFSANIPPGLERLKSSLLDAAHALQLSHPSGAGVDLHWHLLSLSLHPRADEEFWDRALPARIGGLEALVTSREDTLLHVLAHGAPWSEAPPVRWVSDSVLLLAAAGPPLDEDLVARTARRHRLSLAVREALGYLRDVFGSPVSAALVAELGRTRVPVCEQIEHRLRFSLVSAAPLPATRPEGLALAFQAWVRSAVPPGRRPSLRDGVRFLEREWGARTVAGVAAHAAFVLAGRPWAIRRVVRMLLRVRDRPGAGALPVRLGEQVDFTSAGHADPYLLSGWSWPEPGGLWTSAEESRLCLPLARPVRQDLVVTASVVAFLVPHRPDVEVDVVASGRVVGTWAFSGGRMRAEVRTVVAPAAAVASNSVLEIGFVIRWPVSPAEVRYNGDPRRIGLWLQSLRIDARPATCQLSSPASIARARAN